MNGVEVLSWVTSGWYVGTAVTHYIGRNTTADSYFDGYISRVCFIDGQALSTNSFCYFNAQINEWVTKTQSQIKAVVDAGWNEQLHARLR